MLNRRILRTKAFKALYSYAENPGMTLKELEASLEISCESTRNLYLFLLSLVCPLTDWAAAKIAAAQAKFHPSEEELNPNLKFVNNRFADLLRNDPDFTKIISQKKYSWDQYDVLLSKLYNSLIKKPYYQSYMKSSESSLSEDATLFKAIFLNELEDSKDLQDILEDMSLYWNDDLGIALLSCSKTCADIASGQQWRLPYLYQSERLQYEIRTGKRPDEHKLILNDHEFVVNLVRKGYYSYAANCDEVASLTPKWTKDRLCVTDLIVITLALSEAELYPTTHRNIIINEYIELAKCYSTPDSSSFVNGLLDKLLTINNND